MERLGELLKEKVSSMNQDPRKREMIRKWIDGYRGKIICFNTEEGDAYHIVFDRDRATLRPGKYSSCEFFYTGPEEVLCAILRRENSAMRAGMAGLIKGWGSVNEAMKFEALLA